MSKRGEFRQFHLGFWTAANVEDLDPIEKLLYIYMITSPKSNMEGVYKTTLRRIAFETGIDRDMIPKISARFEEKGIGGVFIGDDGNAWVVTSHAPEFMPATEQIKRRFQTQMNEWPQQLINYLHKVGYQWPEWDDISIPEPDNSEGHPTLTRWSPDGHPRVTRPSPDGRRGSPDPMPTRYDTDTDTDTIQYDTDTNTNTSTGVDADASEDDVGTEPREKSKQLAPLRDPIARQWEEALTAIQPPATWTDIAKERGQLTTLAKRTVDMLGATPYQSPAELITAVLDEYRRIKGTARAGDTYWRQAPWTPSAIMTRWAQLWQSLASRHADQQRAAAYERDLAGVDFS